MILKEFSNFLQLKEDDIKNNVPCTILLGQWVKSILDKKPKTNVEKIIHKEIMLAKNNLGFYLLVAKSQSGRTLTSALYNFALSYEQHVLQKWLENKTPQDFLD